MAKYGDKQKCVNCENCDPVLTPIPESRGGFQAPGSVPLVTPAHNGWVCPECGFHEPFDGEIDSTRQRKG